MIQVEDTDHIMGRMNVQGDLQILLHGWILKSAMLVCHWAIPVSGCLRAGGNHDNPIVV